MKKILALMMSVLLFSGCADQNGADAAREAAKAKKPNFLIIVADDLGWSDIGAFGGEISTPNLDRLASNGVRMTNFYVAPTCSPTRSMLMTGLDNHVAGVGTMNNLGRPNQQTRNYAGQIHNDVVTIAEALGATGYETMMSGKWHLAVDEDQRPHNRGFEKSFALLPGGASHFGDLLPISPQEPPEYVENGKLLEELPEDFYSSISYTDKLLEYLDDREEAKPFFGYLAFTAPHDPLQVPDEWMDKYDGRYDAGPEAIRAERMERLIKTGLIDDNAKPWKMPNFPPDVPLHLKAWDKRTQDIRDRDSRGMEIYAAMIELLDQQVGRILDKLEADGELENTYIIFFSDNGPSATAPIIYPGNSDEFLAETWGNTQTNPGGPGAFAVMGREWANVSATPFRMFKGGVGEGGIRSPFIVSGPAVKSGGIAEGIGHVSNIVPTIFDILGLSADGNPLYDGKLAPQGASMLSIWTDAVAPEGSGFATELFGNGALRQDNWKISRIGPPQGNGKWELYNLADDPGETKNVATEYPDRVKSMLADYKVYEKSNGVIPPKPPMGMGPRALYPWPCDAACKKSFADFVKRMREQGPGGPPQQSGKPGHSPEGA
ncbi:MAG: arylsulfatase [Pseudomonadota bacterium]